MDSLLLEFIQAVDDLDLRPTKAIQLRKDFLVLLTQRQKTGKESSADFNSIQWDLNDYRRFLRCCNHDMV